MKKVKVTSLICGGMISLAGTTLLAQSSSTSPSQSATSSQGQSSTGSSQYHQGSSSSSALGTSSSSSYGMQAGQHVRLSELMHAPVQAKDGKQLGHIRDFTVDPQSGRIEFAILSLGNEAGASGTSGSAYHSGTAGTSSSSSTSSSTAGLSSSTATAGGKLIPVPWQLFTESWSGSHLGTSSATTGTTGAIGTTGSTMGMPTLVLNVDESKLQSAPSIQAGNWNELQQSSFDQQVYSHFGVSRSSATGMPGSSISGEGTSGSKSYGGSSSHGSTYGGSSSHGSSSSSQGSSTQPQR